MRSYLFVPADSERKLENAPTSGADCLIVDLEDSVSVSRKSVARKMAAEFLRARSGAAGPKIIVRVNPLGSSFIEEDLDAVVEASPDAVLLPKAAGGADVQHLAVMLAVREAEADLADGSIGIHALVTETAAGTLNAKTYAGTTARLQALAWGGEDLAADLGAEHNRYDNGVYTDAFRFARAVTLLGAAAAKVMAVDTVFTDFRDDAGLERECRAAVRDGFSGKMAIHPGQIETINRIFTPSEEAIARARHILDLFAEAGDDVGVLSLEGQMIDRPHLKLAERVMARAKAAGMAD